MSAAGWRLWVLQLQCCSHCGCFLLRAASAATACSGDFGCSTASRPDQPCAPSSEPPSPTRSGRKRAALTYCLAYTLGCFTKHFNSFWILAGGRVLCGIATSLLFSLTTFGLFALMGRQLTPQVLLIASVPAPAIGGFCWVLMHAALNQNTC